MEFKDYYKILEVKPNADLKMIKTAYRKLARKYHPDVSQDKDAEKKFKDIAEAYAALKDREKRTEYDELRKYGQHGQRFEPPPDWQTSYTKTENFSDFFESIFDTGKSGKSDAQYNTNIRFRGQDIEIELPILLEETLSDTKKTVSFNLPHYDTKGWHIRNEKKVLNVKIPKGITEGERIRLTGQGGSGIGEGMNGDLYLHVRLVPHPLFDVEAHNLIITVPIAPWEAITGGKIELPTLTGNISLNLPPNSQTGKRLRIQGKGLPSKNGMGDLYAVLKIVVPEYTNAETNQLWKTLANKTKFNPRRKWNRS